MTWLAYVPYDVALETLARPNDDPVGNEQRGQAVTLFADVSGFTPLSEALGATGTAGTEELTRILNGYFEPMIALIASYGGIVSKFGGDALTIVFPVEGDLDDTVHRAVHCALEMQANMGRYQNMTTSAGQFSLTMKAGLALGSVYRAIVGDVTTRLEHILAGEALDGCADAEHHAKSGEVVVADKLLPHLPPCQSVSLGAGFSRVVSLSRRAAPQPMPVLPPSNAVSTLAAFLHPVIAQRVAAGHTGFINEHRKIVVLFARFEGFDYDSDPDVGTKLQAYLNRVIDIVAAHDGYLNKIQMGDKGSWFLGVFGAPLAHQDDEVRALRCAAEIAQLDVPVRVGVSAGFAFCGQIGSSLRREYTVIGDVVNLAARLMQAAQPGDIIASRVVYQAAEHSFVWEALPPMTVKGKSEPVICYRLGGAKESSPRVANYFGTMIGRVEELERVQPRIISALNGHGQMVGITGEPGIGKSRFTVELIKRVTAAGDFVGYTGECQSYSVPYFVWSPIWREFFGLNPAWSPADQIAHLEARLTAIDPHLAQRMPLLREVLKLPIPDNALTESLDGRLRVDLLFSLLAACLRAHSGPLFFVLEDCHWIDPLSYDLLESIGRVIVDLPVLIIVVYRAATLPIANLNLDPIHLTDFSPQEAARLIDLKFAQRLGESDITPALAQQIIDKADGNPFYIEEIVNFICDRQQLDPAAIDIPDTLHKLVLSRVDQLTQAEQLTLKIASVIGRQFRSGWIGGAYARVGSSDEINQHLDRLRARDMVRLEKLTPEPEYSFKHIIIQEVTYDSLSHDLRDELHEQIGLFVERTYDSYIDILAYHFGRSRNIDKQRVYFRKAGDSAKASYANEVALHYYERLLTLPDVAERSRVQRAMGEVWELTGQWETARGLFDSALSQADSERAAAEALNALGHLLAHHGEHDEALGVLQQAAARFEQLDDAPGINLVLETLCFIYLRQGKYDLALACADRQLEIANDDPRAASEGYTNRAWALSDKGELDKALEDLERALNIADETHYQRGIIHICNDIANVYLRQGNFTAALDYCSHALSSAQEIGYRQAASINIANIGEIYRYLGSYDYALNCYAEALVIFRELGDRGNLTVTLANIGLACLSLNHEALAEDFIRRTVELAQKIELLPIVCIASQTLAELYFRQQRADEAQIYGQQALEIARQLAMREQELGAQLVLARLPVLRGQATPAQVIREIESWLPAWSAESEQAAIYDALCQLGNHQTAQAAANLYDRLFQETSDFRYCERYAALTGRKLAAPPPLSMLEGVPTVELAHVHALLDTIRD